MAYSEAMSTKYLSVLIWVKVHFIALFCEKRNTSSVINNYYYQCVVFIRLIASEASVGLRLFWRKAGTYFEMKYMFTCGLVGSFLSPWMASSLDTTLLYKKKVVTTFLHISLDLSQMCQTTLQDALLCWRNEMLSVGFSDEISTCVCKLYNLYTEMTLKKKKRFLWSALYFLPSSGRLFAKASLNLITA